MCVKTKYKITNMALAIYELTGCFFHVNFVNFHVVSENNPTDLLIKH